VTVAAQPGIDEDAGRNYKFKHRSVGREIENPSLSSGAKKRKTIRRVES
jgi:hypothetical protein